MMIKALNSINQDKKNILRDDFGDLIESEVKSYPPFPVNRSLSYHADAILLLNELNCRGLAQHGLEGYHNYEFLLHIIPKGRRFSKWSRPQREKDIEVIMEYLQLTYSKASDIIDLLSPEDLERMKSYRGGQRTNKGNKGDECEY